MHNPMTTNLESIAVVMIPTTKKSTQMHSTREQACQLRHVCRAQMIENPT